MQKEHTVNTGNDLDELQENHAEWEKQFPRLHCVGLYLRSILEMTRLWKWRGITVCQGGAGNRRESRCGYKMRDPCGNGNILYLDYILYVSILTATLCCSFSNVLRYHWDKPVLEEVIRRTLAVGWPSRWTRAIRGVSTPLPVLGMCTLQAVVETIWTESTIEPP